MRYLVVGTDANADVELTCFNDRDEAEEFALECAERAVEDSEWQGGYVYLYELTGERKPHLITYWLNGDEQIRGAW